MYKQDPNIFFGNLALVTKHLGNGNRELAAFALKQAQWGLIYCFNAGMLTQEEYDFWTGTTFYNFPIG